MEHLKELAKERTSKFLLDEINTNIQDRYQLLSRFKEGEEIREEVQIRLAEYQDIINIYQAELDNRN